jgi:hypothetical protein
MIVIKSSVMILPVTALIENSDTPKKLLKDKIANLRT